VGDDGGWRQEMLVDRRRQKKAYLMTDLMRVCGRAAPISLSSEEGLMEQPSMENMLYGGGSLWFFVGLLLVFLAGTFHDLHSSWWQ